MTPTYIIDFNLKMDYPILIILGTNVLHTTGRQIVFQVPTSRNICFCK